MHNQSMVKKLRDREAIDLSKCRREGKFYILDHFDIHAEVDYCDTVTESWIWSIGKRHSDGVILASLGTDFYQNPDYHCLWLR